LIAGFAAIVAVSLIFHEMWMDELNPWVIARDARSLKLLFFNMRFEPHPALWYLCLFALTRITHHPWAMQILHGVIATGTAAIVVYCAPFRRRDVCLLVFGYYLIFEYAVISRGYALGVLAAFAACALATLARPRIVAVAVLLALLANTSAFGLIVAGAMAIALIPLARHARPLTAVTAAGIFVAGTAISLWTLLPSPENVYGSDRHLSWSWTRIDLVGRLLGQGYLPLPRFDIVSVWNSSLLVAATREIPVVGHFIPVAIGVAILTLGLIHLRRRPALVAALVTGTLVMLGLMYVEYSGGYRHHGHVFVLLVIMFWLAAGTSSRRQAAPAWFTALLVLHMVAGGYLVVDGLRRPFSASTTVAAYVNHLDPRLPVVVAQPNLLSYMGPTLSGYLDQRILYATRFGVVRGSYLEYDAAHARDASEDEIDQAIESFARETDSDVYVIVSHWHPGTLGPPLYVFPQPTIEGDEGATAIYRFDRSRLPGHSE
jgi:hypothetical protein